MAPAYGRPLAYFSQAELDATSQGKLQQQRDDPVDRGANRSFSGIGVLRHSLLETRIAGDEARAAAELLGPVAVAHAALAGLGPGAPLPLRAALDSAKKDLSEALGPRAPGGPPGYAKLDLYKAAYKGETARVLEAHKDPCCELLKKSLLFILK